MTGIEGTAAGPAGRYVLATTWLLAALVVGVSSSSASVDTAAATKNDRPHARQLQASHFVECGRFDHRNCPPGSGYLASDTESHEVRCCADSDPSLPPYNFTKDKNGQDTLNWIQPTALTQGYQCPYTESPEWMPGDCRKADGRFTYAEAVAVCGQVPNGRLCTALEVLNNCASGTGCGHDADLIWTSTTEAQYQAYVAAAGDPPSDPAWTTLFANDFEDGTLQDFIAGGADVTLNLHPLWTFAASKASIRLVDDNQMASSAVLNLTAAGIDLNAYDLYQVQFWYYVRSFENTEDFFLEYCPDSCDTEGSWQVLGQWVHCCTPADTSSACNTQTPDECHFDNEDSRFSTASMPISGSDPHLRFRSDSSGAGDYLYIDQVEIMAKGTGEMAPSASPSASPSVAPTSKPSVTGSDGPSAVPVSLFDVYIHFNRSSQHVHT